MFICFLGPLQYPRVALPKACERQIDRPVQGLVIGAPICSFGLSVLLQGVQRTGGQDPILQTGLGKGH